MDNIISFCSVMPHSQALGAIHEKYNQKCFNEKNELAFVWSKTLFGSNFDKVLHYQAVGPDTNTEKADFYLMSQMKDGNSVKINRDNISVKAGASDRPAHVFSTSLDKAANIYELIPNQSDNPLIFSLHQQWLEEQKPLSSFKEADLVFLIDWYKANWYAVLEKSLFGFNLPNHPNKSSKASALLLSELYFCTEDKAIKIKKSTLVPKKQVLEDLKILSSHNNVNSVFGHENCIKSGIFSVGRDGGKSKGDGANSIKIRISRNEYLNWVWQNRQNNVWVYEKL